MQKKRVDVWLIYRCRACDQTWNCPVLERRALRDIAPQDLRAFAENEAEAVRCHAFDLAQLRRHVDRIEPSEDMWVETNIETRALSGPSVLQIVLSVPFEGTIRLDRLLARKLGLSRGRIRRFRDQGVLRLDPDLPAALKRDVRDGQTVSIALARLSGAPELSALLVERATTDCALS